MMIRCPFNNFSKCDGSCPFSMPDFSGCRLATSMTAIEGIVRGISERTQKMHIEQVNTNAHLAEVNLHLDGGVPGNTETKSMRKRIHDPRSYLRNEKRNGKDNYCIYLSESDSEAAISMFGESVEVSLIEKPNLRIILSPGDSFTISTKQKTKRATIYISSYTSRIVSLFGPDSYVFLKTNISDGLMMLMGDGDVLDRSTGDVDE